MLGGGVLADRLGRRRVMLGADASRLVIQASLAAALFAGLLPVWLFAVLAGLLGAGNAFFGPALSGLTPEITPGPAAGRRQRPARGGPVCGPGHRAGAGRRAHRGQQPGHGHRRGRGQLRREPGRPGSAPGAARAGRGPLALARPGGGLGGVPGAGLAVDHDRPVRAVQPVHLGAVPAADPDPGPRLPGRRARLRRHPGQPGRGRDCDGPAPDRPPPAPPADRRHHRHLRLRGAVPGPGPAPAARGRGQRRRAGGCGLGHVQHLRVHRYAAAGAGRPARPRQCYRPDRRLRPGRGRLRRHRLPGRPHRPGPPAGLRRRLHHPQQHGRSRPPRHPRHPLARPRPRPRQGPRPSPEPSPKPRPRPGPGPGPGQSQAQGREPPRGPASPAHPDCTA